ncbi:MAG TPA: DUF3617 family protein [Thermoanaerobaculia bacterium]|jgi:hypothetical protein|nr:DUF3617 family protein [Thermoanaerobaculia bacterium]
MKSLPRVTLFSSIGWLLFLFSPALHAADRMAVGQWDFDLTTDGTTHTSKHCVTPEEAAGVNGSVTSAREHSAKSAAHGHCALTSFEIQGDKVSYALACGTRTIESQATYHGETFEGILTTSNAGKVTKTSVKAHRVGACP